MENEYIVNDDNSYLRFDNENGKLIFGTQNYEIHGWYEKILLSPDHHRLYIQLRNYWEGKK